MSESEKILKQLELYPFKPVPWATSGVQQTIAAYYYPYNPLIDNKNLHKIPLYDGDKVLAAFNYPKGIEDHKRIVLLVHGLSGTYNSKYMIRMTQKLNRLGYPCVRMNLRGTGPGRNIARKMYHGGISEDPSAVLEYIAKHYPKAPVTLVGFSLGANILMKLAGEHKHPMGNCDSLITASPPLDLYTCVKLLSEPHNQIMDKRFAQDLSSEVMKFHKDFNLPKPQLPKNLSVFQFDDLYTSKVHGFENAVHYYNESSAMNYLSHITIPTFILHALDDPIIVSQNFSKIPQKPNFDCLLTEHGGHVAWLGKNPNNQTVRWMDEALVRWILQQPER